MRIFVSSTVYDLLDIRAEVEAHLRSLGFSPVMSDSRKSEFDVKHPTNSIETCLINLRGCEVVIVILDKRYGPSLKSTGIADVSATHLEYREAVKKNLPICFYVRDRLEADYRHWQQEKDPQKRDEMKFAWVKKGDERLFEFLDERKTLEANAKRSNWFLPFSDSIQLKETISRDLGARGGRVKLNEALRHAQVPTMSAKLHSQTDAKSTYFELALSNLSQSPIVKASWKITTNGSAANVVHQSSAEWLAQSETFTDKFSISHTVTERVIYAKLDYRSMEGFHVRDLYKFEWEPNRISFQNFRPHKISLMTRTFAPASPDDPELFRIVDKLD